MNAPAHALVDYEHLDHDRRDALRPALCIEHDCDRRRDGGCDECDMDAAESDSRASRDDVGAAIGIALALCDVADCIDNDERDYSDDYIDEAATYGVRGRS